MDTDATKNIEVAPTKGDGNKFVPFMFGLAVLAILSICGMAFFL